MLRVRSISNQYKKRPLRAVYAQTQATPYSGVLHPSLRNEDGSFAAPSGAYLDQGGLVPGMVMAKNVGESFSVHTGAAGEKAFGLLANYVGGQIDEIGDENSIAVWRGPDSVWELLAPAFDDTGMSTAYDGAAAGSPVPLYTRADGRLGTAIGSGSSSSADVVAELIEYTPTRIVIDLKV